MINWDTFCEAKIPERTPQIDLPPVRQMDDSACGAAALRAVFAYWGVEVENEKELKDDLGTNAEDGTLPDAIVRIAKSHGLQAKLIDRMSLDSLRFYVARGAPVICAIQAWGTQKAYKKLQSGHYIAVTAVTKTHVFFQDPSMAKYRGTLPVRDFAERWKDVDAKGRRYFHLGIPIWGGEPHETKERHRAREIR